VKNLQHKSNLVKPFRSCYHTRMPTLIRNKKIHLDYELLEQFEAGVELFGFEVKSLRNNHGSLEGAYAIVRGCEAFLIGAHIPPFQQANTPEKYDPYRNRRLLLTKKELARLAEAEREKGLTIAPISWYTSRKRVKIGIAIARGKKKFDKRETLKKKDAARDIARDLREKD